MIDSNEYIELKLTKGACKDLVEILTRDEREKNRIEQVFDFENIVDWIEELFTTIGIQSTEEQREMLVSFVDGENIERFHRSKGMLDRLTK